MVLCSQYLRDVPIPCVAYKRGHGIQRTKMKVLQLFPVRTHFNYNRARTVPRSAARSEAQK